MEHIRHLKKDTVLKKIAIRHDLPKLKPRKNVFIYLVYSIMSQQLSIKVADVIKKRFLELFGGKEPSPEQVLKTEIEQLRKIGLSYQKANYIHNIAQFTIDKGIDLKKLSKLSNEEVIEYLTEIKGVGRWTVEMLMMFALGREDIFSAGDYGIQTAMINLYNIKHKDKKKIHKKMISISESWAPYRTYACMYLWRWKDLG